MVDSAIFSENECKDKQLQTVNTPNSICWKKAAVYYCEDYLWKTSMGIPVVLNLRPMFTYFGV